MVGRKQQALQMRRDVYSGYLKLDGEQHLRTLIAADNYALSLNHLKRFKEAKSLMRKTRPVAQSVLGASNDITIRMMRSYAQSLYRNPGATLDDLREAVSTLEDAERIARRVFGGAHPLVLALESSIRLSRKALQTREASPGAA